MHLKNSPQRGSSLVSVLVAVGIMGFLTLCLSKMLENGLKGQKSVELRGDLESIRRTVLNQISCTQTLQLIASPSTCNQLVSVKKNNGSTLIDGAGTTFGAWTLRGQCLNGEIYVQAARLKSGAAVTATEPSSFREDPLTGELQDWDYQGGLFPTNVSPCEIGSVCASGSIAIGNSCVDRALVTFSRSGFINQDEMQRTKAAAFAACATLGKRVATVEELSVFCSLHAVERLWTTADGFWLNAWSSKSPGTSCGIDISTDDANGVGYLKVLCAK